MLSALRRHATRALVAVPRAAWKLDWLAQHRQPIHRIARALDALTRPALRLDEGEAGRAMHKAGWWG